LGLAQRRLGHTEGRPLHHHLPEDGVTDAATVVATTVRVSPTDAIGTPAAGRQDDEDDVTNCGHSPVEPPTSIRATDDTTGRGPLTDVNRRDGGGDHVKAGQRIVRTAVGPDRGRGRHRRVRRRGRRALAPSRDRVTR
jgi:hypothetical protein